MLHGLRSTDLLGNSEIFFPVSFKAAVIRCISFFHFFLNENKLNWKNHMTHVVKGNAFTRPNDVKRKHDEYFLIYMNNLQ